MQCTENCNDPNPANRVLYEQPVWQTLQMFSAFDYSSIFTSLLLISLPVGEMFCQSLLTLNTLPSHLPRLYSRYLHVVPVQASIHPNPSSFRFRPGRTSAKGCRTSSHRLESLAFMDSCCL